MILAAAADSRNIPRPPNCAALWVADFGAIGGVWQVEKHPRFLADVNADGKADIVGFGDDAVWVSTSTGTGFTTPALWVEAFAVNNGGWQVAKHPRFLADVNADGKADIVGFGNDGGLGLDQHRCAASPRRRPGSTASPSTTAAGRSTSTRASSPTSTPTAWPTSSASAMTAVWVSISTGAGFTAPALWVADFALNAGGWQVDRHPRFLADVNADGKADIVGFGDDGGLGLDQHR